MRSCWFLVFALPVATYAVPGAAAGDLAYYSITLNGKLIGYATVESEPVVRDGAALARVHSETHLKTMMLGKARQTLLASETLVHAKTAQPVHYDLTDTTNDLVQQVECEFSEGVARTWSYRHGQEKPKPLEIKVPADAFLMAGNDFGHLRLLAASRLAACKDATMHLSVFVPEAGKVESLELVRGGTEEVDLSGTTKRCVVWRVPKENFKVFLDAATGEFVALEIPAQHIRIALTNESVAKRLEQVKPAEVLTDHFIQSDVTFDDYKKITFLKADIDADVIGSGVDNEPAVLTTAMQKFTGRKEGSKVNGTVIVNTGRYDGKDSPSFPSTLTGEGQGEGVAECVRPSYLIESDYPAIVSKAAELTKDARSRWEATLRIARWVNQEVRYTIADSPSARLALETRKGDCGPHATLTVALLRAAGIPARLVGGLLYAPAFGGSFGQHAWCEVHMGRAGWVPLDPTTGELESLNATHIKLFEGMGGVVPRRVHVVEFQPPNRPLANVQPAEAKPLPWQIGKRYLFRYKQGETDIGTEAFTITKVQRDGKDAYEVNSDVDLKVGGFTVKGTTRLSTAANGEPFAFVRDLDAAGQQYKMECAFKDGEVDVKVSGAKELTRQIKIPRGAYCFDNNLLSSWAIICPQLHFEKDEDVEVRVFHPSSLQVIPLTFKPQRQAPVSVDGKQTPCWQCEVDPIQNTFWITGDGRFVKAQQGKLTMELAEEKK